MYNMYKLGITMYKYLNSINKDPIKPIVQVALMVNPRTLNVKGVLQRFYTALP